MAEIEDQFLYLLERALQGWTDKVKQDFSNASYEKEIDGLANDDVYSRFQLDCPEYVLVRLMGRMSISVGRRLGELYDNLPKFVAAARFGISQEDVAAKIGGLNLDVQVPFGLLEPEDERHVRDLYLRTIGRNLPSASSGLGIEIRYNFNPNDSARLRKDEDMAAGLKSGGLAPIYLVFSSISPRQEAIARLERAGWQFLIGDDARTFTRDLLGLDITNLLESDSVQARISKQMGRTWEELFGSYAYGQVSGRYPTST